MLIDTHTHLYLKQFDDDRKEVIERAEEAGIKKFFLPNIDSQSIDSMLQMEIDFPNKCFAMMGLHPCSVKENYEEELKIVENWLQKRKFCAIGEIGIDLYWDKSFFEQQKKSFLTQVEWAIDLQLPIVIHCRESIDIVIDLLQPYKGRVKGIFHCFGGTIEQSKRIIDLGFLMGIGGVLTFKKAKLDEVIKEIPLECLVLETDSPYLAPAPHRGKRNESSYVKIVAEKMAEAKNMTLNEVAEVTTNSALNLFK